MGAVLLPSIGAGGLAGDPVGLDPALLDARRFLGLAGGGGNVENVVAVAAKGAGPGASIAALGAMGAAGAATVVGDVEEADTFWRFCDGGDLSSRLVWAEVLVAADHKQQITSSRLGTTHAILAWMFQ